MHSSAAARHSSAAAVQSIARALLAERLDHLTDAALARLMHEEPAYAALTMDPEVRRAGMRSTLEFALSRLAGDELPPLSARVTTEVGRERAEQGFPLTALMHSFQLDLRILWEAVLEAGRARGISSDPGFLDALIRVWEATEANTVEVVEAYRRTERDLASQRGELQAHAFKRLILSSHQDPAGVADASRLLGLPVDQRVLVLVGDGVEAGSPALRQCREALKRTNAAYHLGWIADELIGVAALGRRNADDVQLAFAALECWRCGVTVVADLTLTTLGVRLARAARRGANEPGVHALGDHWLEAAATADDEVGAALARAVLTSLVRSADGVALLETLRSYLRIGSVVGVADDTYRHRNTVRNRLRTIEAHTGLDLSVPRDIATLGLAVAWWDSPSGRRSRPDVRESDPH